VVLAVQATLVLEILDRRVQQVQQVQQEMLLAEFVKHLMVELLVMVGLLVVAGREELKAALVAGVTFVLVGPVHVNIA
jgi:hypothetical protein